MFYTPVSQILTQHIFAKQRILTQFNVGWMGPSVRTEELEELERPYFITLKQGHRER